MKFELVWSEKFDYSGKVKADDWTYVVGGNGFGNKESQYYNDRIKNVEVVDNQLFIRAFKETFESNEYTSGMISTKGKRSFQYGKFIVKAKIPKGNGTWPAIWMMPENDRDHWPLCGEIDIMEHIGRKEELIHFTIHSGANNHKKGNQLTEFLPFYGISDRFAEYELIWTPEYFEYLVDGVSYAKFDKSTHGENPSKEAWPFDQPFYLMINLAIGGYWGGAIDDSALPAEFIIDFVEYYQIIE